LSQNFRIGRQIIETILFVAKFQEEFFLRNETKKRFYVPDLTVLLSKRGLVA
jgi:hypothetical protein